MEDKIIYVVTEGSYSDYRITGVFDSEAKAQRCVDLHGDDARIEEYLLNELPDVPENMLVYVVSMAINGDSDIEQQSPSLPESMFFMFRHGQWRLNANVYARDPYHAVKIVNEKRAMLIAADKWPRYTPDVKFYVERIENE